MALVSAGGRRRKVILLLVVLFAATHCEEESSDHTVEVEGKEEEEEGDVGNVDVTKMTLNEDEINLISRPDHSKGLLQGDILLTPEQEKMMRGDVVNKRAVVVDTSYLWPGAVVPYSFTSSLPSSYRSVIIEAMNEISDKSCVEFVPRSRETHYIRFISGDGCYSYIGRLGRGSQDISIGRGCQSEGIVMHEIIHALGRWHEQSRPDRDRYIEIHHENILRDYEDQFRLVSTSDATTNNIAYDYYSIMHYGAYAFSKNYGRSATITPRDAKIDLNDLGQRRLLSTKDIEHIQQLYCGGGGSTAESEWSSWSSWSQCSSSCGSGLQSRSRTCLPANSGAGCPGHNRETRFCDPDSPNCSGQWFPWTSWSSCTPSCGSTRTRTRTRSCRGLGQCSGDSLQTVSCASRVCPENVAEWSSWTSCSQTCRRSYQLRVRTNCGNSCPRPRYEFRLCSMPSYCFRQWRSDQQVDSQLSNNSDVMGMNATATTNGCPRNHQPMLSFLSLLCLYYLTIAVVRVL